MIKKKRQALFQFEEKLYRDAIAREKDPAQKEYKEKLLDALLYGMNLPVRLFPSMACHIADKLIFGYDVDRLSFINAKFIYRRIFSLDEERRNLMPVQQQGNSNPKKPFRRNNFAAMADTPEKQTILAAVADAVALTALTPAHAIVICRAYIGEEEIANKFVSRAKAVFRQCYANDPRRHLLGKEVEFEPATYQPYVASDNMKQVLLMKLATVDGNEALNAVRLADALIAGKPVSAEEMKAARTFFKKRFAKDPEALLLIPERKVKGAFDPEAYRHEAMTEDQEALLGLLAGIIQNPEIPAPEFSSSDARCIALRLVRNEDTKRSDFYPAVSHFRKLFAADGAEWKLVAKLADHHRAVMAQRTPSARDILNKDVQSRLELIRKARTVRMSVLVRTLLNAPFSEKHQHVVRLFCMAVTGGISAGKPSLSLDSWTQFRHALVREGSPEALQYFANAVQDGRIAPERLGMKSGDEIMAAFRKTLLTVKPR